MRVFTQLCCLSALALPLQAAPLTSGNQSFYLGLGGQYQHHSYETLASTDQLETNNAKPSSFAPSGFLGKRFNEFGIELGYSRSSKKVGDDTNHYKYTSTHTYLAASYHLPLFGQNEGFLSVGAGSLDFKKSTTGTPAANNITNTSQISALLGGGVNFDLGSQLKARVFAYHQFHGNQYISKKTTVNLGLFYNF